MGGENWVENKFFRRRRRGSLLKRKPRMRGRRNISKRSTSEKRYQYRPKQRRFEQLCKSNEQLLQVRQNIRDKYGIEKKQPTKKSDKQTAAMMEELRKEYGMDDEDAKELQNKMDKVN